jgi:rubredoxin
VKRLYLSYELSWRTNADEKLVRNREWKEERARILTLDDYKCTYCGYRAEKGQNVDHIDGDPKNNAVDNLEVTCPDCHKVLHAGLWVAVKHMMRLFNKSNYSQNDIIRLTREMRSGGKTDKEIIEFLGLKEPMPWKEDLEYLKPLHAFISSAPSRNRRNPT